MTTSHLRPALLSFLSVVQAGGQRALPASHAGPVRVLPPPVLLFWVINWVYERGRVDAGEAIPVAGGTGRDWIPSRHLLRGE